MFVLWIVCLLRESLAHGLFSGLFVCNARVSCTIFSLDCLFVTQEFRALFFLLDSLSFSRTNLFFNGLEFCTLLCFKFACRLRKNLAHSFFPGFVCSLHKNIAHCLFCSFACLLPKNLAHSFFPGCVCSLHTNLAHCYFSNCWFVTQESCAFFLLKFACLLRENLAHSFFPWFVDLLCKNRAPCFVLICWFVTQECRALFLL